MSEINEYSFKKQIINSINENKKLKDFLIETKTFGRFVKNTKSHLDKSYPNKQRLIKELIKISVVSDCIFCSFNWNTSTEGYNYWKTLYSIALNKQRE